MFRRLSAAALALVLTGCIHSRQAAANAETLPEPDELGVEDPDPEKDQAGPEFCNPAGKQGEALRTCFEHNESLYSEFADEAKAREPWYNFTPDSWAMSAEVDPKYVLTVVKPDEAVKVLEAAPLVELDGPAVAYYTGKAAAFPGLKAYLVRGLMYFKNTGAFSVFQKGQAIFVRHDSTGDSTPAETRSAVVVFLAHRPNAIYVDCQVAE